MTASSTVELACKIAQLPAKGVAEILQPDHALPAGPHYDAQWEGFGGRSSGYEPLRLRILSHSSIPSRSLSDPLSDTCKHLRGRILKWFCKPSKGRGLFWVTDPFVSCRDVTVVEAFTGIFVALNRLGSNSQISSEPPQELILQVAYHLASQYPPYRGLLTRELVDDPTVIQKSPCILFKRLIVEPWDILAASHPIYLQKPPLIILDFLGDPRGIRDPEIVVLIELVREHSGRRKVAPLLWLICSHPDDRQLNQPLLAIDAQHVFEHEAWTYDSAEAKQDVNDILRRGFRQIRKNHPVVFVEDEQWPLDAQLDRLASVICGVPHFACSVVQFVGGKGKEAKKQLETCIEYMSGCPPPLVRDPFSGLDHFYFQILSNLPPDALDILYFSNAKFDSCSVANLLRIDRIKLYDLFSENMTHLLTLRPCEGSDGDFIAFRDKLLKRFYDHATYSEAVRTPFAILRRTTLYPAATYGTFSATVNEMTWKPSRPKDLWQQVYWLRQQAEWMPWRTTSPLEDGEYDQLGRFDFRNLISSGTRIEGARFKEFLLKLKESQPEDKYPLVRTKPVFPSDRQLIEKCKTLATPMPFDRDRKSPASDSPQYALLGRGIQTVLVILLLRVRGNRGVNIYSLDMLDDL